MALLGVVLLTEPWHGDINVAGIGFAALAAIGWAAYILLTQRVGDRFAGIGGLTLTIPVAAVDGSASSASHRPAATSLSASSLPRSGWRYCSPSCRSRWRCSHCVA